MSRRFFSDKLSFAVFCAALVCAAVLFSAPLARAYEGVLAPDNAADAAGEVYEGVIAPDNNAESKKGGTAEDPRASGDGRVMGLVDEEAPMTPIEDAAKKMTPIAGAEYSDAKIRSSQQIRNAAMRHGVDKDADGVPDKMAERFRLTPDVVQALDRPQMRYGGLLRKSHAAQVSLDAIYKDMKAVPASQRGAAAKKWIDGLKMMQAGLRVKKSTPDSVYKTMGLPEVYVREEREDVETALQRVDETLKMLESYTKE